MRSDVNPQTRAKVAAAIGRGAELIRARGHCVGALNDDSGRLCLMGAIREAAKDEPRTIRYSAYDEVNKRLRRSNHDIAGWNDEQTDKNRVADLLDGVAQEVDPTYTKTPICWHGTPLHTGCVSCAHEYRRGRWAGAWHGERRIAQGA